MNNVIKDKGKEKVVKRPSPKILTWDRVNPWFFQGFGRDVEWGWLDYIRDPDQGSSSSNAIVQKKTT